jgi:HSP20 family molecular chaperone IbpA
MSTLTTYNTSLPTYTVGHYSNNNRLPALFHDRWFDSVLEGLDGWTKAFDIPNASYPYNVKTTKDKEGNIAEFVIEVALAGVGKNNIDVKVSDGHLTIGVKKEEDSEDTSYVKRGISKRKGEISFALGDYVNVKKIESTYIDGLLRVIVPIIQPETINIDIKVK